MQSEFGIYRGFSLQSLRPRARFSLEPSFPSLQVYDDSASLWGTRALEHLFPFYYQFLLNGYSWIRKDKSFIWLLFFKAFLISHFYFYFLESSPQKNENLYRFWCFCGCPFFGEGRLPSYFPPDLYLHHTHFTKEYMRIFKFLLETQKIAHWGVILFFFFLGCCCCSYLHPVAEVFPFSFFPSPLHFLLSLVNIDFILYVLSIAVWLIGDVFLFRPLFPTLFS